MITTENLPIGFKPYPKITVCSNTVIGGGHLVAMGKVLPLLIGMGPKPIIWLQAATEPKENKFITIVDASIATHPLVRVAEQGNKIIVSVGGKTLLIVEATSLEAAVVTELDLRPLGLNIYGNTSQLSAGGMHFISSTFAGVGTVIGFAV